MTTTKTPTETPRRGDWTQTFTGKKFYTLDPTPDDVSLEDIAHALAQTCRFNGHCSRFYSVAQHSVFVSHLMAAGIGAKKEMSDFERLQAARTGLLHDAAEAYIGDMVRPLKISLRQAKQPFFDKAEEAIMAAVELRFGVTMGEYKDADNTALYLEAEMLVPHYREWTGIEENLKWATDNVAQAMRHSGSPNDANMAAFFGTIPEISFAMAKDTFLRRARELGIA